MSGPSRITAGFCTSKRFWGAQDSIWPVQRSFTWPTSSSSSTRGTSVVTERTPGAPIAPGKSTAIGPLSADRGNTVVAHATRLEFQDGKRKRGTQKYHGRGTTHCHSLDFLENMESIGLESKVQATIPPKNTEPLLHGLVTDSQCDYKDSGLPVREEPSAWDPDGQKVLLHHTEDDKDAKVRAYFKDTMEVTKCHEDVQQGDGNGAVLRYVSTYNMKFQQFHGLGLAQWGGLRLQHGRRGAPPLSATGARDVADPSARAVPAAYLSGTWTTWPRAWTRKRSRCSCSTMSAPRGAART